MKNGKIWGVGDLVYSAPLRISNGIALIPTLPEILALLPLTLPDIPGLSLILSGKASAVKYP